LKEYGRSQRRQNIVVVIVRRQQDENGKEAREETEGKSDTVHWGW